MSLLENFALKEKSQNVRDASTAFSDHPLFFA